MQYEIKNFILTRYLRKTWDNMPQDVRNVYGDMDMNKWDCVQEDLYKQQIKQIKSFYPKANIHVLTNDEKRLNEKDIIVHFKKDMPSSHISKLLVYGLLDEPAMYIDNDIIICRKWNDQELETENPFNFYIQSGKYNIQAIAKEKLHVPLDNHWNAGVIWIKKPSKKLVEIFQEYHWRYFSDKKLIINHGNWADSDELPVALYIIENKLNMNLSKEIGVPRKRTNFESIINLQSIHYTGIDIEDKKLCIKDYKKLMSLKMV